MRHPPAVLERKAQADDVRFEHKKLLKPFTAKLSADAEGSFAGCGMIFDSQHPTSSWQLGSEWKDRVRPGAFTKSLGEHKAAGTMPLMLFMHERGNIPGVWTSITEDKQGLQLAGQVAMSAVTPSGVPLYELMKMGAITGLSIGFRPTKVALDEETKLRDILEVELGEVSVVDIPGSSVSRITDVKRDRRGLESALREAGLSRREAKALLAEGFQALKGGEPEEQLSDDAEEARNLTRAANNASEHAHGLSQTAREKSKDPKVSSKDKAAAHQEAHDAHKAAAEVHRDAATAHRGAASSAEDSYNETFHNQAADRSNQTARGHDAEAQGHQASADEWNRDKDGQFAGGKKVSTAVVESIHALRDAVANDGPTQRDADRVGSKTGSPDSLVSLIRDFTKSIR